MLHPDLNTKTSTDTHSNQYKNPTKTRGFSQTNSIPRVFCSAPLLNTLYVINKCNKPLSIPNRTSSSLPSPHSSKKKTLKGLHSMLSRCVGVVITKFIIHHRAGIERPEAPGQASD